MTPPATPRMVARTTAELFELMERTLREEPLPGNRYLGTKALEELQRRFAELERKAEHLDYARRALRTRLEAASSEDKCEADDEWLAEERKRAPCSACDGPHLSL